MHHTDEYDVLIIGGRVAGSSLGALLARQGRRVLVADRSRFPSDTLSTHCMSPNGVGYLRRLSVLDDLLAAGFRPVTRHRTSIAGCVIDAPAGPGGAFSLAPRRDVLDDLLVRRAAAAGAEVMTETRAESLRYEGGRVAGAVLRRRSGEAFEVRARVTVGADGRASDVARWVDAPRYLEAPGIRPAYYAYLLDLEPRPEPALEFFFEPGRIGFVFPMRPGEDCVALEIAPGEFERFRSDLRANFMEGVRALPGMAARMERARLEGPVFGQRGFPNVVRRPYGEGWLLAGDAACLKDPATGLGMTDALTQAVALAEALEAWFGGAPWEPTMAAYQERRDAALLPGYRTTLDFTRLEGPTAEEAASAAALLSVPAWTRLALGAAPGLLPDYTQGQHRMLARLFARSDAQAPSEARELSAAR